jgi:hypothetical protein
MFFGSKYFQIQMWPSPNFWEGHKLSIRTLPETANANLVLSSFVQVLPVDRSVGPDDTYSFTFLSKWDNGGPAGDRTLQDDTITNLTLTTFINYVAVSNSVTDTTNANTQLTFWLDPTPVANSFQDDTNAFLALTKWQQ